jgi:hypothetical protein
MENQLSGVSISAEQFYRRFKKMTSVWEEVLYY